MPTQPILAIRQSPPLNGHYPIRLTLKRPGQPDLEGEATIAFALTDQEQADLRWYLEEYLQRAPSTATVQVDQIERLMRDRGEELYTKVLAANFDTQAIWFGVRERLADLRIEITTPIAEAAAIPWELLRDPQSASPLAVRVAAFVRVQSNPNLSFVRVTPPVDGIVRLLYVVCRPGGARDVALRAVANRLLHDLGDDLTRFSITALRPPTFEQLQRELTDAKAAGCPYQIVHFDGHGTYTDLSQGRLAGWLAHLSPLLLGGERGGKQGYLLFEAPGTKEGMRPVPGAELGQLLHDNDVPLLVLNACQSAMHEATARPESTATVHDEVRAIGSLAQAVIDQGIPAVLGMRYSVYVVTAAQYIGELYRGLAQGWSFGQAASNARKHLQRNPERWVGLRPRALQDWFVPVVYEAMPLALLPPFGQRERPLGLGQQQTLDPVQRDPSLLRYVPDHGFVGRDETLLLLDRAFDTQPVVLLHAYAGQGKTTTAVEFARWYAQTGGLGAQPLVLFTSFESHADLALLVDQAGQPFVELLRANNIEWHAIGSTAQRRDLVLQLLRLVPVLWIWDNVEPVTGFPAGSASQWADYEQQELADFLKQLKQDRATKVKLLLTSRRDEQGWLGGIPHRIAMPRMSAADAAKLALQLGQERKLTLDQIADWQPLLDYCAGNPLTLRVIAGQAVRLGLHGEPQLDRFVQTLRDGETAIDDVDAAQGRDRSLGASLDYGFRNAFTEDELPIIALLHLFQGMVDVDALNLMGKGDHALPELAGKAKDDLTHLLTRAAETGLLTHLESTWYTIHPALPWFLRQRFARHYDGQEGRSTAVAALRAWVEALGELGHYYWAQYEKGNRAVIQFLILQEANLLHAYRLARRHGWWRQVLKAMQGLRMLYGYLGRRTEWGRLVYTIVGNYCTNDDEPVPGREDFYSLVMDYRVDLARHQEHNLEHAAALQEKRLAWDRKQADGALALSPDKELDSRQRYLIRMLGVSVEIFGHILREQGKPVCVNYLEEAIKYSQRISDISMEASAYFNLGRANEELPSICDLDAAEMAYRQALELLVPEDKLLRSICTQHVGIVYRKRLNAARQQNAPAATQLAYAQAAEAAFQDALLLCPTGAVADLGRIHDELGILYNDTGQTKRAREHYEQAVDLFARSGNQYDAAGTRYNMALMYRDAAGRQASPAGRRTLLVRARAYAAAALADYQHYQGRAADMEAQAQGLIDEIDEALGEG